MLFYSAGINIGITDMEVGAMANSFAEAEEKILIEHKGAFIYAIKAETHRHIDNIIL